MSDIVYLKVSGEQQGAISDGCGTSASVGNRRQVGHEDEIFVFSLTNSITSTGKGSQFQSLRFCKLIDKCSPLLINAINNNEQLYMEFYFYRINPFGRWEKYYYIQLRRAFISSIYTLCRLGCLDTETIAVDYEYILCQHLIANTEYSYLTLPSSYNRLFVPSQNGLKTLNSKSVGRLLAAGGIYNGNIEGFHKAAEQLGGDAPAGYDQVLNKQTQGVAITALSIAAGLGLNKFGTIGQIRALDKFVSKRVGTEKIVGFTIDDLSKGASVMDKAGLTKAGRALQKHGDRAGSIFPKATGDAASKNAQGQQVVDNILNDSTKTIVQQNTGRFGQVIDIVSPNGLGIRYDSDGTLIGFLEP